MRLGADDDRTRVEHGAAATQQGFLKQRVPRSKCKELFRLGCARQGPQAGAGATAQDNWNDAQCVCSPGCICRIDICQIMGACYTVHAQAEGACAPLFEIVLVCCIPCRNRVADGLRSPQTTRSWRSSHGESSFYRPWRHGLSDGRAPGQGRATTSPSITAPSQRPQKWVGRAWRQARGNAQRRRRTAAISSSPASAMTTTCARSRSGRTARSRA